MRAQNFDRQRSALCLYQTKQREILELGLKILHG